MATQEIAENYAEAMKGAFVTLPLGYKSGQVGSSTVVVRGQKRLIVNAQYYLHTGWHDSDVHPHNLRVVYNHETGVVSVRTDGQELSLADFLENASDYEAVTLGKVRRRLETDSNEEQARVARNMTLARMLND